MLEIPAGETARRRQRKKGGFASQYEAQLALDDARKGLDIGERVGTRLTVGDWLDEWLTSKRAIRIKTREMYTGHIAQYLRPHLGRIALRSLRVGHVAAMFNALEHGGGVRRARMGPATMQRVRATLRAALNDAIRHQLITVNPATLVQLPPGSRPPVRVWSAAELRSFLTATANDPLGPLFHVIAALGLRRGEACGLTWQDIDFTTSTLRVSQQLITVAGHLVVGQPKTSHGIRVLAIDVDTLNVLHEQHGRQRRARADASTWTETGFVFTRPDGRPHDPAAVTRRFHDLSEEAGLSRIRLHDLRHTSASVGLAAGESMKEISERLGHSSISITADTYTHVAPALARESAERRAALLRADPIQDDASNG